MEIERVAFTGRPFRLPLHGDVDVGGGSLRDDLVEHLQIDEGQSVDFFEETVMLGASW
jgi:hypothetical protein